MEEKEEVISIPAAAAAFQSQHSQYLAFYLKFDFIFACVISYAECILMQIQLIQVGAYKQLFLKTGNTIAEHRRHIEEHN